MMTPSPDGVVAHRSGLPGQVSPDSPPVGGGSNAKFGEIPLQLSLGAPDEFTKFSQGKRSPG